MKLPSFLDSGFSLTAPQPQKPELRGFDEPKKTRQRIYDQTLQAAKSIPPLANQRHTLKLSDVDYTDPGEFSLADQKSAVLNGGTLGRKLRGTWQLLDNATGQVLDQRKQTLATVPYYTDRGTVIHKGNEWILSNQLRLRPGVFTRVQENGEVEAHVNLLPGTGPSHRYYLDPEKGAFYMKLGQAKIPVLPLMRAMGATDAQLREAWGPELLATAYQKDDPQAIQKIYQRLRLRGEEDSPPAMRVAKAFSAMTLDPEVSSRTLGKPFERLDLDTLLATTRKLVRVSRGEDEIDDRDNLAFQTFVGPEDLLSERIAKDAGGLRRKALWKASYAQSLKTMPNSLLGKQLEMALLGSGLGNTPEEINPSEMFDKQSRFTRLGEGGIPSVDSIPDEARSVQPSHLAFVDPVRTPESMRAGIDLNLASGVKKGSDGRLYAPFRDVRTGQTLYRSPQDVADLAIAFSGEMDNPSAMAKVMQRGRIRYLPKSKVDLEVPDFERAFSTLANLVPMKSGVKGQRLAMGSRMITQALSLEKPESPLVQTGVRGEENRSYEELYSTAMGAVRADQDGRVVSVEPDGVTVQYADGTTRTHELFNHFPYARKSYIHNTAVVRPGDSVRKGGLLARSNYTDGQGVTALGLNARVAYLPFRGGTFEDAIAISESMAKRLSSEHMYQQGVDFAEGGKKGKSTFVGLFPGRYDRQTLDSLDDDGVIKPGTTVNYGQPLVLAAEPRQTSRNKVHRRKEASYSDRTDVWKHHSPGIVTDVVKRPNGVSVLVKSTMPMQVGDKMSGRFGDKGVVAQIIPDNQMPHDEGGRPAEVLVNPLGIISRGNPSQIVEAVLGKIAASTGRPYKVVDFDKQNISDWSQYAQAELQKHGLRDLENVTDPETGRRIPGVLVGNRFFMKLHHQAESKGQGRGTGGYTAFGKPAKGGDAASKQLSLLETNALLSHGAYNVLRDAHQIRGQRNEDGWMAFMSGHAFPKPDVPDVYKRFLAHLEGSGIHVVPDGPRLQVMALTDKDVDHLAGDRELQNVETVDLGKGLQPIKGGLFDESMSGGHRGNRWMKITLSEPMPNPVMEDPIRHLLGLTKDQLHDVLAGRRDLQGGTGPKAIAAALDKINVPRALLVARAQIKSGRKGARDQAIRRLGYLAAAQRTGSHPRDWMLTKAPVLPPVFRPVSLMSDSEIPLVSDANYLYKELFDANQNLREMRDRVDDVGDERLALYHAFKAVTGLGDPLHPKLKEKRVRGLLKEVFGSSPKFGMMQRQLLSTPVDVVGRAVISPNPNLDMDHVGLPEDRAWAIYKNFIVRRLKRRGMSLGEAARQVRDRSPMAREEMLTEMRDRPVIVSRAPVLHRFGIMAFFPKLVSGDTLQVSPLVVKGFGADFDGDQSNYHVPVDDDAKQEAIDRMLPSRNLLSPADFQSPLHAPSQEMTGGLYYLSSAKGKRPARTFATKKDAIVAYLRGELDGGDEVEILEA